MFSRIKRIVFIGGNRFKENGPLLNFIDVCIDSNIDCVVISDQDRSLYPTSSLGNFSESLEIKQIDLLSIDKLSVDILKNYEDDEWFKQNVLQDTELKNLWNRINNTFSINFKI